LVNDRELLDAVLEHLPLGIMIWDPEGHLYRVNTRFTELTGYLLEDVATMEDWARKAYPDEAYRQKMQKDWDLVSPTEKTTRQFTVRCKDGKEKNIAFCASFLPDQTAIVSLKEAK